MAGNPRQFKVIELSPGNTGNATFDSNVVAGNTVLLLAGCYNTSGTATFTGSDGSNTYTTRQTAQTSTTSVHIATAPIGASGALTVTATIGGSTGDRYLSCVAVEVEGVLASAYDVSASSSGNSTAGNAGTTAAKAQNQAIVFTVFTAESSSALSAVTGFTTLYLQASSATFQPIYVGWKVVNASGTETASDTLGVSCPWGAAIVVLKEDTGGSPAVPDNLVTMLPMRPGAMR